MVRTRSASSSTTIILRSLVADPSGTMPPTHSPLRLDAAILSRMRSDVTSRSNWAKDSSTFRVKRPIDVVVLNCWVTETKETSWASNSSTSLKNRILLNNYYLPGDLERQIGAFVEHYNHVRYHESISNLTPADVYFGRAETILAERQRIKRATITNRRLQHQLQAA